MLGHGTKIAAVKMCREATRMDLKEAKDYVEQLAREAGLDSPQSGKSAGCAGMLLLWIILVASLLLV